MPTMTDDLVQPFVDERQTKRDLIVQYGHTAKEEGRDLNEVEKETIKRARTRIKELDEQIDLLADDLEMAESSRDKLRSLQSSKVGRGHEYQSAGQLLWDALHRNTDDNARTRFTRSLRAAEHMGIGPVAGITPTAGTVDGMIIRPTVGPVIDPYPSDMPFASALGLNESPEASHFFRPRLVDANAATGVGVQALMKGELASKAFSVEQDAIALETIGGYLNLAQQMLSFAPGSLELVIRVLNRRLSNAVDLALLTELAKSTGKEALAANATGAAIYQALLNAAVKVYQSTGRAASWVVMGPLGWARLAGLVDAAGRPLFPPFAPANPMGSARIPGFQIAPAGLPGIVTNAIADANFWVGNSDTVEGYMYRFPVLEAVEPSVLGRQVAVAAAVAGYRPVANGAVAVAP